MSLPRRQLGAAVEDRVAQYLLDRGWTLVTRRCTIGGGELDLVAFDGDELVFVEVKSRRDRALPEESVTPRKAQRLRAAARAYIAELSSPAQGYRFDIVAVDRDELRHHERVLGGD